jgi:hypothetical protein
MWWAQKPFGRALAILDGDGDKRTRVQRAAIEIVGLMERTMPPAVWEHHHRLVERVTCVRSPEGAIPASVAQMTAAAVSSIEAEVRALATALG